MCLIGSSWDPSSISALAAICGSLVGAAGSSVSAWIAQRHQGRRDLLAAVATVLSIFAATGIGCHRSSKAGIPARSLTDAAAVGVSSVPANEALHLYQKRAQQQLFTLAAYSDELTIQAEVPASSQTGEVSLRETFATPHTLSYTSARFSGDGFINQNVITRLLESNVDHVRRGMESKTAILERNYKFFYKGTGYLAGRSVYRFAVVPRHKITGLFKGEILLDPRTGHILRAAGRLSKSPSWWIKRIEFTQDYADVGDFTLPVHTSSLTQARMIGRVVVTIRHSRYEVRAAHQDQGRPETARGILAQRR